MKPDSPRAKRRHAKWRKVERAKRIITRLDKMISTAARRANVIPFVRDPNDASKWADNMKFCRHVGCRNKRKLEGPTRRELRQCYQDEEAS